MPKFDPGHIAHQVNYGWRLLSTGFSFFLFGLGGVLIPALCTPLLYVTARNRQKRQRMARSLVQLSFKTFIHIMRILGILRWDIEGAEKLRQGCTPLVLANHPTLIDVVFLVALIPNANCVVKGNLRSNPAMRGFISLTGYIPNDEKECLLESIDPESTLIVFPEGTRTTPKQPLVFQRGAANIAIRTRTDMTPVIIRCSPSTLSKEHRWYHIPDRRFTISITVEDNIAVSDYLHGPAAREARRLTAHLQHYFSKELQHHEQPTAYAGAESLAN